MKKPYITLLGLFLLSFLFLPKTTTAKQSLVVKDLTPEKGVDASTGQALSTIIRDTISQSGNYNVQSLDDLAAVSKIVEEKLKLGCDDTKCLIELGGH